MEISKLMGHSIFSCTPPTVDSCPGGQSHNVDSKSTTMVSYMQQLRNLQSCMLVKYANHNYRTVKLLIMWLFFVIL